MLECCSFPGEGCLFPTEDRKNVRSLLRHRPHGSGHQTENVCSQSSDAVSFYPSRSLCVSLSIYELILRMCVMGIFNPP